MIQEDYVSFEVAKLLKEKEFNWDCITYYVDSEPDDVKYSMTFENNTTWEEHWCSAPTLQMAMKWLREVHNKHCDIGYDIDLEWYFQIIDLKETVEYDYPEPKFFHAKNEIGFKTYEEAVEAALKYALENLI